MQLLGLSWVYCACFGRHWLERHLNSLAVFPSRVEFLGHPVSIDHNGAEGKNRLV